MNKLITNYTFNKTAKTIAFTDYTTIELARVQLIVNVTDNIIIYQFNKPTLKGSVATNVLTLDFDTTGMDDADKLKIIYDHPTDTDAAVTDDTTDSSIFSYVRGIIKVLNDVWDSGVSALGATLTTALTKTIDSIENRPEGTTPINKVASGVVYAGPCRIAGFYVHSTSSGVIKLHNHASAASSALGGNITPAVGWHSLGNMQMTVGAFMELVSGSIDITWAVTPTS